MGEIGRPERAATPRIRYSPHGKRGRRDPPEEGGRFAVGILPTIRSSGHSSARELSSRGPAGLCQLNRLETSLRQAVFSASCHGVPTSSNSAVRRPHTSRRPSGQVATTARQGESALA